MKLLLICFLLPVLVRSQCCDSVCGKGNVCSGSCIAGVVECYCENSCSGSYTICASNACGGVESTGICFGGEDCVCWGGFVGNLCVGTFVAIIVVILSIAGCVACCCCGVCGPQCQCFGNPQQQPSNQSQPTYNQQGQPKVSERRDVEYA